MDMELEILKKLEFSVKGNSFFFYIPSELSKFLIKKEDFEKYKDLLIPKFQFIQELPLIIKDNEIEYYDTGDYDIYYYLRVINFDEQQIIVERIQHNCYNPLEKSYIFLRILFYFLNIERIYEALCDVGLGKLIKKP